jgi:arginase
LSVSLRVLQIPYDSGHRGRRMGTGPLHLLRRGALDRLRRLDPDVVLVPVETAQPFPTEIGTAFALHRALAEQVAAAVRTGATPLVLSGNCNSSLGTVAGLQQAAPDEPVGVLWLDGHGDCNTPETFTGDFLDAMGLSTLTGRCWQALAATVPGFSPVSDERVVLVGGHGMDAGARSVLNASRIINIGPGEIHTAGIERALRPALARLRDNGAVRLYVHLDVDVLDRTYAPANGFAPEGGLLPDEILDVVTAAAGEITVAAAAVASYDPAFDRDDRVLNVACTFLEVAADAALRGSVPG